MVIVPRWSANVACSLATPGCTIWINCTKCGTRKPIDLAALVLKRNPLYSLWNRRPPCPTCGSAMLVNGAHAAGAFVVPLITPDPRETDYLHDTWALVEERVRRGQG